MAIPWFRFIRSRGLSWLGGEDTLVKMKDKKTLEALPHGLLGESSEINNRKVRTNGVNKTFTQGSV